MTRFLEEFEIKSERNKSNWCKSMCIDEGKNFCPFADYSRGLCCDLDRDCTNPTNDRSICSQANPDAPPSFKYYSCPNESFCGERLIQPVQNVGVPIRYTREPDTKDYNFKKHDVCSYLVKGDDTMKDVNKINSF